MKMPHAPAIARYRQRGVTLVEFMVGMTVGLLVVLAAAGSLVMTRASAQVMTDSATLEQQASLVMMLMGQQIKATGSVNAYLSGANPDTGIQSGTTSVAAVTEGSGKISFDTRPTGIAMNGTIPIYIYGQDGTGAAADTFTVAYAVPNDGASASNCIGTSALPLSSGGAPRVVSIFSINASTHDLLCGSGNGSPQPIASNVMDMQVQYLTVDGEGNIIWRTASRIGPVSPPSVNWANISGLEICLHMQGDVTQAPVQRFMDCRGNNIVAHDGRVHRIIRQTFHLRNAA